MQQLQKLCVELTCSLLLTTTAIAYVFQIRFSIEILSASSIFPGLMIMLLLAL